jgi:hypothetical protein
VSNSIQTLLKQLFSRVNPDELDLILTPTQREGLLADVGNLTYFSATMDGFTDQLLTRKRGTHLQPNSLGDEGLKKVLDEIGLGTPEAIALMDFASPYTPFASLTLSRQIRPNTVPLSYVPTASSSLGSFW